MVRCFVASVLHNLVCSLFFIFKQKTAYELRSIDWSSGVCSSDLPHPAIVRLSDFKTNEYAHLVSGDVFEPEEENPMLGFRGASRYYDDRYREGFALECRALKREIGRAHV